MSLKFLIKCFFIGMSAASGVGPIFVLTFNRGAIYGFPKGFATALGAAIADGFYFALGLLGALNLIESSNKAMLLMDLIGGGILIYLGMRMLKKRTKTPKDSTKTNECLLFTTSKSLIITLVNPFIILFFMFISIQILPEGVTCLPIDQVATGGLAATGGSLLILSSVAFIASHIGSSISYKWLRTITHSTAFVFIGAGIYLTGDFVISILKNTLH